MIFKCPFKPLFDFCHFLFHYSRQDIKKKKNPSPSVSLSVSPSLSLWPLLCRSRSLFPGDDTSLSSNTQAHTHTHTHTRQPDTVCQVEPPDQEKGIWFGRVPGMNTDTAGWLGYSANLWKIKLVTYNEMVSWCKVWGSVKFSKFAVADSWNFTWKRLNWVTSLMSKSIIFALIKLILPTLR